MARILFVISTNLNSQIIAGHFLSTLSLARRLRQRGHHIGLAASLSFTFPELEKADIQLYHAPYPAFFQRPRVLRKIYAADGYQAIVSMDVGAAWHAWLPAVAEGAPIIQVIPGGPTPRFPVIQLPHILVFSQELYDGIPAAQGIPQDYLVLSAGRIDFEFFENEARRGSGHDLGFEAGAPRLLIVSRLQSGKQEAIQILLEQVREAARLQAVQLAIVGEGDARSQLEAQAAEIMHQGGGRARICFLGGFRVTPADLRQADLVIGQGRTVVEAIASGVPAAVCGAPGYFGLLTPRTLPGLARSNLTGRGVCEPGSLLADLEGLAEHKRGEFDALRRMVFEIYDVSQGARTIETIVEKILAEPVNRPARSRQNRAGYLNTIKRLIFWSIDKSWRELKHRGVKNGA